MAENTFSQNFLAGANAARSLRDEELNREKFDLTKQKFNIDRRQKRAELERFTETSNMRSMAINSAKLLKMPFDQQNEYLEQHINTGEAEGRDMQDSREALKETDPKKRNIMFQNVIGIAEKMKIMQRDPRPVVDKYGSPFKGVSTKSGKPGFYQVNQKGQVRELPGVQPAPPKGSTATRGSSGIPGLSKKQSEELYSNRKIMGALSSLKNIEDPMFLTFAGKAKGELGALGEKLQIDKDVPFFGAISEALQPGKETKEFMQKKRQWRQEVKGIFNDYRRIVTGAAAPMGELKDLEEAMLNPNLSWSEYQGSKKQLRRKILRINRILRKQAEQNIQFKDREAYNKWFNREYQMAPEDNANTRGAELKSTGMSDSEVLKTLQKEF